MLKKVRISTLIGDYNYGNRLQNYALSKTIKEMGFDVKTLNYKYVNKNMKMVLKEWVRNILIFLNIGRFKRERNFKQFNTNISFTKPIYLNTKIETDTVDYFVTGSDQVWNYQFSSFSDRDLLLFSEHDKNISYAASFGFETLPEEQKDRYQRGLENIKSISVRETSGIDIVKKTCGKDSTVVIDPTLLVTKGEWEKLEKRPKGHIDQDYILVHVLGDDINFDFIKQQYGMEMIQINHKDQPCYYECGPSEYLYLVHHAKMIITDSYHACIFSIIYQKPFFVYDRIVNGSVYMQARIDTLLNLFQMKQRRIQDVSEIIKKENAFAIDTSHYEEILQRERKRALLFLDNALHG